MAGRCLWLLAVLVPGLACAQSLERFVLGQGGHPWPGGGDGTDATVLARRRVGAATSVVEDTTNTPGRAIDFVHRPGWVTPLHQEAGENIAGRALQGEGAVSAINVFFGGEVPAQLQGIANGDHSVAFERKPTPLDPDVPMNNVWVVLDFARPLAVSRIRFYPRNTVVPTPEYPYQGDFLRAYEVWVNAAATTPESPDILVQRDATNEEAVVDVRLAPRYVRQVKIRSLAAVPFEIDEVEVYGEGYAGYGTYLSDVVDLGGPASIGPLQWVEAAAGDSLFSALDVRVRTGADDTPILYQVFQRDAHGAMTGEKKDVAPRVYYAADRRDRVSLKPDETNWSPWTPVRNGQLMGAPLPRRYVQFELTFTGRLTDARAVQRLWFDHVQPPVAQALHAEVYPRQAEAEKPATFRYAVKLGAPSALGAVTGYERLEVDTNVRAENLRGVSLNGRPARFTVVSADSSRFVLGLPLIRQDGAVLEFAFDLPIFRFGTTFWGRAYHSRFPGVPQALEPGNATTFAPDDVDELSTLFVAIPRRQMGRLVGEITLGSRTVTPNGDRVHDQLAVQLNLLQLLEPAPVSLEVWDLAGHRLHTVFAVEHGIGPLEHAWDCRTASGEVLAPGLYLWVLRVKAQSFEERHSGVFAIAY
ncbi:MAG: hypothetical protein AB1505_11890 [Candidatus Latescibacterota bacterium]